MLLHFTIFSSVFFFCFSVQAVHNYIRPANTFFISSYFSHLCRCSFGSSRNPYSPMERLRDEPKEYLHAREAIILPVDETRAGKGLCSFFKVVIKGTSRPTF